MEPKQLPSINIEPTSYEAIVPLRQQFLEENNFQIRYDSCHYRGWADSYFLRMNETIVGYGSIKGMEALTDRDTVFEYFVLPPFRKLASTFFSQFLHHTQVSYLECQTNDPLMSAMMFEFGTNIRSEVVLFGEHHTTMHSRTDVCFRKRGVGEEVFGKKEADAGQYVLEREGEIVADGGFLTHYNPPFADVYMEVKSDCRNEGLATFILQEIKKECYLASRVPAARCNISNPASRAALLKAGFQICGFMLLAQVKQA